MIEFQNYGIALTTVNAGILLKILKQLLINLAH